MRDPRAARPAQIRSRLTAFHTIGHSTRGLAEFVAMLQAAGVTLVADVRTAPRSRTNPQYNRDDLPGALARFGIGYEHIAELGGLRSRDRGVSPEVNAFWRNSAFHNYADYAMGEGFRAGLARLRELNGCRACAVMCAEALWWRCHRRIIADYLMAGGETVFHLMGEGQTREARMTEGARLAASGVITYPQT